MRNVIIVLIALSAGGSIVLGSPASRYVIPRQDAVNVYAQAVRPLWGQAQFVVGPSDRLTVLSQQAESYQVQTDDGRRGWVEKRLVVPAGSLTRMTFGESVIAGYLNTPDPAILFGDDEGREWSILLDRSFRENLSENIDRETAERSRM
jgi:hypothetical protein